MINRIDFVYLLGMIILILALNIGIIFHSRKLSKLIKKNNSESTKNYSREIIVGLVSALIILVLDRTISQIVNEIPKLTLDISSVTSSIFSLIGVLLPLTLIILSIVFCIIWIIYLGFPKK